MSSTACALSPHDLRLEALQNGSEQRVVVNQKMLIDKMLARYSSDFAVFRELIQNSDDAQASSFHLEITCNVPVGISNIQHSVDKQPNIPIDFHNSTITEIRSVNNGFVFSQTDWRRVASIAEGNTNVDSVGQFGVGFFSVFSFSKEPIITSGNEYMIFIWRDDDSLTTFRHELPIEQRSKLTSVILKMQAKYVIQIETNQNDETTDEHTTMNRRNVTPNQKMTKKVSIEENVPSIDLTKLKIYFTKVLSFTKYIKELAIKINGFTVFQIHKTTTPMPSIPDIIPFQKQASANNILLLNSLVQTEQTFTIDNSSTITLNHITVDAKVTIDEEFHNHIQAILKKRLPSNIQIQFLFASNSLIANQQVRMSSTNTNILNTLIPLKFPSKNIIPSGHIFIGLGTHQTTGIGMHIYSHLIPTIERENIDLQNIYIAKWNKEILVSAGQIVRYIYDQDMLINSKGTQGKVYEYSIVMAPYSFQPSVPNNVIGQMIVDGFFASDTDILVPVQMKPSEEVLSVLPSTKAFLCNSKQLYGFLVLPLIPFQLKTNGLITTLVSRHLIDYVDKSMIERTLMTSVLSPSQFTQLLHWLFGNGIINDEYTKRVLSNVCLHDANNHPSGIPLKNIEYYDVLNIPSLLPTPLNILPKDISTILSQEQLEQQLGLLPLKLKYILDFYLHNKQLRQITSSETFPCLLSLISTHSSQLTQDEWTTIIKTLSMTVCIPTTQGMKLPREAFVLSASVSPQLPCIILNILRSNENNKDKQSNENLENPVSIQFLKRIGCRMVNLDVFDDDNDDHSSASFDSETMRTFIQTLIKERMNMSPADFDALKEKPSLKGTTLIPTKETTRKYVPRDLYFPSVAIQLEWTTLPIIDWPNIHPSSPEYAFLKEIGVREVPTLHKLVERIIEEHNTGKQKPSTGERYKIPHGLIFFAEKFERHYHSEWQTSTVKRYSFLPSNVPGKTSADDVILLPPNEVFRSVNPLCPSLLPDVLNLFQKHSIHLSLDIDNHPPLSKAFNSLLEKKTTLLTKQTASTIFAYLHQLKELDHQFIQKVAEYNFIPLQDQSNSNTLMKPSQVFIHSNITPEQTDAGRIADMDTSGLIDYVDFGTDANAFLLNIGVASHPKPAILAKLMIDRQANYFADAAGNHDMLNKKVDVYISCLKILALAAACSKDLQQEPLYTRLRTSAWCLGFRMTERANGTSIQIFKIVRPDEVYLDDNHIYSEKFRPLLSPCEGELSKLYPRFGSRWLSECVKQTKTSIGKPTTSARTNKLQDLIQYRFPMLFVNDRGERLENCIEERIRLLRTTLSIYEVDDIKCVLTFENQSILLDSNSASPCVLKHTEDKVTLNLRKDTGPIDYYFIAVEFYAFCFTKHDNHVHDICDKLGLPLEILKRRGTPVDRLLKNTQTNGELSKVQNFFKRNKTLEPFSISEMVQQQEQEDQQQQQQHIQLDRQQQQQHIQLDRQQQQQHIQLDQQQQQQQIQLDQQRQQQKGQQQQSSQKQSFLQNLRKSVFVREIEGLSLNWWSSGRKTKNSSVVPIFGEDESESSPATTTGQQDREVGNQNRQLSPVIGVGGDYTIQTYSSRKHVPMPDFRDVENEKQHHWNKIYQIQSYNHSKLIQLEHTKTEISTACEQIPPENMTRFNRTIHSIPLYVEQNVVITETMVDQAHQLAFLLINLAIRVFKISKKTLHLFRDVDSGKIAFNYEGALFFNLRYFEQIFANELKPYLRTP
ncbi:unnamed protein product, partial [Adineta ricciae]